ncbi:short-chain dehydrogenase [Rhodococcus sp. SRB_17]|nr:short-chain dehydrogenase [Rhodococcus sp. SRB_17]
MIDKNYYGPWAVIAGGSEGVGSAYARQLATAGINLVLLARKSGPLEETASEARALGVEVTTLELDLLDDNALDRLRAVTDPLDVGLLVFNAGAGSYASEFVSSDLAAVQRTIDLNIKSQLALTHHFGGRMKERGSGGIILMGSISGYLGTEHISFYAAAKAFGRIFAEGLWLELAPLGVHVLEVIPGATRTPALGRLGLNLDMPGLVLADPEDVAREGLEHLDQGPIWITTGHFETAQKQSGFDRSALLLEAAERFRKMSSAT